MRMIVGLGNPGLEYAISRHNCGFLVIDQLAQRLGGERDKREHSSLTYTVRSDSEKILLAKPQTYMNNSGFAVSALVRYYKMELSQLLIIYDDMDLEPATLRFRRNGSSGGHNGMQSIIEQLGSSDISRLKVGIGHGWGNNVSHVLGRFDAESMPLFAEAFDRAAKAAICWAEEGIGAAMNKYNGQ